MRCLFKQWAPPRSSSAFDRMLLQNFDLLHSVYSQKRSRVKHRFALPSFFSKDQRALRCNRSSGLFYLLRNQRRLKHTCTPLPSTVPHQVMPRPGAVIFANHPPALFPLVGSSCTPDVTSYWSLETFRTPASIPTFVAAYM